MKSVAELEQELRQAAENMQALRKAAKDQAARLTAEPVEPQRSIPGVISPTSLPTVPTR